MSSILVTGGTGFIGSHIAESALINGHRCICIDKNYTYPKFKNNIKNSSEIDNFDNLIIVEGDILDLEFLKDVISEHSIEYIYHQAAKVGVRPSLENPLSFHEVNARGTLNILLASIDNDVKGIINASSSSVYGKASYLPLDEEHPTMPISPYGVTKLIGEHYMRVFSEIYGLSTVSLRYFTVYGPRMGTNNAISIFIKNAIENRDIEIFGNGHKSRDYTYVSDIVEANLSLMDKKFSGEVFNIGRGEGITIKELSKTIIQLTGSKSNIIHLEDKKEDIEHELADTKKIQKLLGWRPVVSLEEGLKKYCDFLTKM